MWGQMQQGKPCFFWLVLLSLWISFVSPVNGEPAFDPAHPLPGGQKPKATGSRAILPATLSLAAAAASLYVANDSIVGDRRSELGFPPTGREQIVGLLVSAGPSVGRLLVPSAHPYRWPVLCTASRIMMVQLFLTGRNGVSPEVENVAIAGFLALSALDVGSTALLRFPGVVSPVALGRDGLGVSLLLSLP